MRKRTAVRTLKMNASLERSNRCNSDATAWVKDNENHDTGRVQTGTWRKTAATQIAPFSSSRVVQPRRERVGVKTGDPA